MLYRIYFGYNGRSHYLDIEAANTNSAQIKTLEKYPIAILFATNPCPDATASTSVEEAKPLGKVVRYDFVKKKYMDFV